MSGLRHHITLILVILFLQGCREVYYPDIEKYENILVVDGLITDQPGPHTVRLSRSFAFDESFPDPEEGAAVILLDEYEQEYIFLEEEPGIYRSSADLQGETGGMYQLFVTTVDGEIYESEWVELRNVPAIDSVTFAYEERPAADPDLPVKGVNIKIHTRDRENRTRYYRWEWTETWEFVTPLGSSYYPGEQRCWKTIHSSRIAIGTSEHLSEDLIRDYPLYFVSTANNRLKIRYSTEIHQYALSLEAYSYWKGLQEITQNTGSLFDPTPAMVTGNITNPSNPEKPVIGIFQASAVSRKRLFIDHTDIPESQHVPSGYEYCDIHYTTDSVYYAERDFIFIDTYMDGLIQYFIFANFESCFRCTLAGYNEMPEYWPR